MIKERPIRKEETAMMIGRSLRSLEREMRSRRIRYHKCGKTVVFFASDIEAYLARCCVNPKEKST